MLKTKKIKPEQETASQPEIQKEKQIEHKLENLPSPKPSKEQQLFSAAPADDSIDKKTEALKQADKLRDIKQEGRKIENLLALAKEKGVKFAIDVAKKTNDSALLDLFHDKIIEKGLHKKLD